MKVLTINTHSWLEENQEEKCACLAQIIAQESFDVIALQEVNQRESAKVVHSPLNFVKNDQAKTIKEDNFALYLVRYLEEHYHCTYYWTWAYNHRGYDQFDEGVALLSKTPFTKTFCYPLSKATDPLDYHTRVIVGAELSIAGKAYQFYSVHASWWTSPEGEITFPYEAKQLANLQEKTSLPIFIMGDFNNPSSVAEEGYDLLKEDWYDTYLLAEQQEGKFTVIDKIAGWDDNTGGLRLDFILTSQALAVQKARVFFDGQKEAVISDHFGFGIEFKGE